MNSVFNFSLSLPFTSPFRYPPRRLARFYENIFITRSTQNLIGNGKF